MTEQNLWPQLSFGDCRDSLETLHMKMQVIGKVKLALTPFINHWWNVGFFLNASGMTTGLIPFKNFVFEINFNFLNHELAVITSENKRGIISLSSGTVADFYKDVMNTLNSFGIVAEIDPVPTEVPDPIRCDVDMRSAYNKEHIADWWKILLHVNTAIEKYRSLFRGKQSPVLFYWGSFDLNQTRFSGKPAAPPAESGIIMKYAENEENFAVGFWHGSINYPKAAFYSYFYPALNGIENTEIMPEAASYNKQMGEFIMDYDYIRNADDPESMVIEFFSSTYEASAKLAGWKIDELRNEIP